MTEKNDRVDKNECLKEMSGEMGLWERRVFWPGLKKRTVVIPEVTIMVKER